MSFMWCTIWLDMSRRLIPRSVNDRCSPWLRARRGILAGMGLLWSIYAHAELQAINKEWAVKIGCGSDSSPRSEPMGQSILGRGLARFGRSNRTGDEMEIWDRG